MDFHRVPASVPLESGNQQGENVFEADISLRTIEKKLLKAYKRDPVARAVGRK
jgi:hypothetical protein